jgi:branched-chain amino acid transport system permease protein
MQWVNAVVQGVLLGGLYALFATGLSLAFGVMRFVNLAHGDLAILGAYFTLSTAVTLGVNPWLAMVLVIVVMAAIGYVGQRGLFNFTLGADPLPSILVSFGLGVVIQNALLEYYTATDKAIDAGTRLETDSIKVNDTIAIGWLPLLTLVVAVVVLGGLQLFLSRTRLGRAFRATADDPTTAQLMGINDKHLYGVAMAIAFATVALAGFFLGARTTFAPSAGPSQLLFGFEAVVIGGLGSLWGTLVGGIVLGVAQALGNQVSVEHGFGSNILFGHLVFLAVLAFRPNGIFGRGGRS